MRKVELTIEDVAYGGKGVARENGKAVFIPFTIAGEKVEAQILRERKKFARAEVLAILEPSAHRVTPECPYFGRCGGCSYQHIDYEQQLAIKWRQVRDVLQRIGKLRDVPMRPIIPSPRSYAYRNRITVHAEDGVVGFFHRDSHRLIDIERCPIAREEVNDSLTRLRSSRVRDGHYTLRADAEGPRVFVQANDDVASALRELVVQLVPPRQDLLIDAYCGAGFFAKALLEKFERVIGIDWDRFAIQEAEKSATSKETYRAGDMERVLIDLPGHTPDAPTNRVTLIADPPDTGIPETVRHAILALAPQTFIYVSCNPSTLGRDLRDLQEGFTIESVTPLDMFPQTAEIEVAVHLQARPAP
ncbi:MAG TPA: class I SAM-dependent RNA methyltransferase [Chthoniobacterales bacterium]